MFEVLDLVFPNFYVIYKLPILNKLTFVFAMK